MNIVGELAEKFSNKTIAVSAEDKKQGECRTLAVSRHFLINNIFATDDQPNYPDHDFPYANAKLVPAGYLLLKSRTKQPEQNSGYRLNANIAPVLHHQITVHVRVTEGAKCS